MLTSGINLVAVKSASMTESFASFGYPESLIVPIGILESLCALIYVIPRTSVLGAILLTAYLGGAVATHTRIKDPTLVVPIVVAVMIWAGIFLRDPRLSALIPLRKPTL